MRSAVLGNVELGTPAVNVKLGKDGTGESNVKTDGALKPNKLFGACLSPGNIDWRGSS